MVEFLKHFFGVCGDGHPSVLWLLSGGAVVWYYLKHNIEYCWKRGCEI